MPKLPSIPSFKVPSFVKALGEKVHSRKKEQDQKVEETAKKVEIAAESTIEKSNEPGRISRAYSSVESLAFRITSYSREKVSKIYNAVKGFFSSFSSKARNERKAEKIEKSNLEKVNSDLREFSEKRFNAVRNLENIERNSNEFAKREQNNFETEAKLFDLLKEGKVSKADFDKIMLGSDKQANRMIYVDSRYGEAFKNTNAKMSYKALYEMLMNSKTNPLKKEYDAEVNKLATTLAASLKNINNVQDATKFSHSKFETANQVADKKEYVNILGKNKEEIKKDLDSAILAKLGGKKAAEQLIKNVEALMNHPYDFASGVAADKGRIEKDLAKALKGKDRDISDLEKKLKELDDELNAFDKEVQSIRQSVDTDVEASAERREVASEIIAGIKKNIEEINAQKELVNKEISNLNKEKPMRLEQLRYAHLADLNAQRRELGKLIDVKFDDIEDLPREAGKLDTAKRYAYNATKWGSAPTILGGLGTVAYSYAPVIETAVEALL